MTQNKESDNNKVINPISDQLSPEDLLELGELLGSHQHTVKVRKKAVHGSGVKLAHSFLNMGGKYYVIEKTLGTGSVGTKVKALPIYFEKVNGVFVRKNEEGEGVIIKVVRNPDYGDKWEQIKADAEREINSLKLSGDTSAELVIDEDRKKIYIKQRKISGVSLQQYLEDNANLSLVDRLSLIEKIANEVIALHAKGLAHLDIHDGNIMIDSKGNPHIIDFGSAVPINTRFTRADNEVERTLAMHRPFDYSNNAPVKVDHYILAGVFGNILAAPNIKVYEEGSSIQRIMRDVKALYIGDNDANAIADRLKKRAYQFDKIPDSEQGGMKRQMIVLLKQLGNETPGKRMDLQEFAVQVNALAESAALNNTPINRLTAGQREVLLKKLSQIDIDLLIKSTKPAAKALGFAIASLHAKNVTRPKFDDTIIKLIENIIDESVEKQKDGYGFFTSRRLGGSNVLKAILNLPQDLLRDVDPAKIKLAERFSKPLLGSAPPSLS